MVSVVYCSREANPKHKEHLINSSGLYKNLDVIEIVNNGESLTKSYNRGLAMAKNDIVVFCHDDIKIETSQWARKLEKIFTNNPDFGIIGVAGSKYMPTSGKWWENPKKMYGRVQHTSEGKSWLSAYSPDLGNTIENVVTVDGLFFAISKSRIKKEFDESVDGFHFYDVDFTFSNYLSGVGVGVTTLIRVNHSSIGMTNDKWEINRELFSKKYKHNLPANIQRTLRPTEKLKVLMGCLNFKNFTGSELYVFELAKELILKGCEVSVCSNIGEPLMSLAHKAGIKMYSLNEPPNYKLGDGKWSLKGPDGNVVLSQVNNLYKLSNIVFDVMHLNHKPVTEHMLRLYPDVDTICTIHSEVIALEDPVIAPQIKKYIAVRPEIKEHLIDKFEIRQENISVIYNPINQNRFKVVQNTNTGRKNIIFIGTIDYLRKNTIQDLIKTTAEEDKDLWIVGAKNDTYLDDMMLNQPHVTYFPPLLNVEKLIQKSDQTAGILLGRTTIEGWLCGKSGWIYDVDNTGEILSKALHEVPFDIDKFKSETVAEQIIEEYKSILS